MKKLVLKTGAGDTFNEVAKEAKERAERHEVVEFEFNGVTCLVNSKTIIDYLWKHYCDAHIMEWKTVGPDCWEYDPDTKIELHTRRLAQAKEEKKAREERDKKDNSAKLLVEQKTSGIELEIIPGKEDEYAKYVETNSKDGYSRGVIDYGEAWAKLMQIEITKGRSVKDVADEAQKGLGYLGITGFMYGCAVNALSHFWKYGEDLRKWHNKEYGHEGDGVVNPAVLTISTP